MTTNNPLLERTNAHAEWTVAEKAHGEGIHGASSCSGEFGVDDVGVLLPFVLFYPHLRARVSQPAHALSGNKGLTFLKVLKPARMLPPVHVV
jgi:hypothetical protein